MIGGAIRPDVSQFSERLYNAATKKGDPIKCRARETITLQCIMNGASAYNSINELEIHALRDIPVCVGRAA